MQGDRIAAIVAIRGTATREIDASGLAVAPGFINMLSWATESLLEDDSCVGTAYFIMSEENIVKKSANPGWRSVPTPVPWPPRASS